MAVVHEIKSPIVAAQSIVEMVKQGYVGDVSKKIEEKLKRTKVRTEEALALINNILRISKLKLLGEVTFEKVDVLNSINLVSDNKSESIQSKNIQYEISDLRKEKDEIDSDPMMIELIFSNIIGNAVKYTPENGRILIELMNENGFLKAIISDSGIGIPQNEIEKIFQQFYRATNLSSKKYEGSGLGLSLVKEIVERSNGKIEIKSPSKIGTKNQPGVSVTVKLPILQNI
jgi:signal transduction histidine kinase